MDHSVSHCEVQRWLEWAGGQILTMPVNGTRPQSYKSLWPDYPDEKHTAFGYTGNRLRPPTPQGYEIELMDEILALIHLVPNQTTRRVLQARSLVLPLNGRHLYSWSRIAQLIHSNRQSVAHWHRQGLGTIADRVEKADIGRFRNFFPKPLDIPL